MKASKTAKQLANDIDAGAPDGLQSRYRLYLAHADDGKGCGPDGHPLKSFDDWLNS
jgi:hypothetical protein